MSNNKQSMTPKEKAINLVDKYNKHPKLFWEISIIEAKQCALIAVDEILDMKIVKKDPLTDEYWEEVKQEIEKYEQDYIRPYWFTRQNDK